MSEASVSPVVLINIFKCQAHQQEELMERLRALNAVQKSLKGFVSGTLHRGLNGRVVANRAVWDSAEDWKAMSRHPHVVTAMSPIIAIATFEPNLYEVEDEILA